MNISAVSSLSERSQAFIALQNTLQAGNLSAAQRAFAAFQQDVQKTAQMAGPASLFAPGTQASKDLQSVGSALKSANLTAAQSAFAMLQQDIQSSDPSNAVLPVAHSHRPLTQSEIANNGMEAFKAAAPGSAAAQSIGNILNLKA
jgi:hypothetical protein